MRWRVLKIGGSSSLPTAYDPLLEVADIITVKATREEVVKGIADCDACLCGLDLRLGRDILKHATRLRMIAFPATGRDHIDLEYAAQRGIGIMSLKDDTDFLGNVTSTAEMAWALMLATVRHLPWAFDAAKDGRWRGSGLPRGHQIAGKTLGILGYGRLGRIVGQYGRAFRMRVLAHDVREVTPEEGIGIVDLDTLLRESDILSLHIHLQGNEHFVNQAFFDRMKSGAVLINTSRGGIIDEDVFISALKSGKLAGAAVDVIDGEWGPNLQSHPLIQYANEHQNLIISPHIAGATVEAQEMTLAHTVGKLRRFLESLNEAEL
jgi:D-3-phosphoglycerate dehydrogenase